MRLQTVQVTNYKSIEDSGEFSINDLTCLVGKNESGKTAILEALYKLNPLYRNDEGSFSDTDYPRRKWSQYREHAEENPDTVISTIWKLEDDHVRAIEELVGSGVLSKTEVKITKKYNRDTTYWTFFLDEKKAVENLVGSSGLSQTDQDRLAKKRSVKELLSYLNDLEDPSAKLASFRDLLADQFHVDGLNKTLIMMKQSRLPKFVLFRNYDQLPGRVQMEGLLSRRSQESLDMGDRIFLALLELVGATPDGLRDTESSEHLIAELEAVSNRLSEEIFEYWSQNRHLEVLFTFGEGHSGDPEPFNTGHVFQTRIRNQRHRVTVNFDERSTGFIWFFSFLVWFSQVHRNYGDEVVILLDEPGLSLHATAQSDLLRYIKDRLLPVAQVIYTTHSPFMIDTADILSARTVEDATDSEGRILGTKVGDEVLSTDADTVFPLQAALGYDITQSLFIGEHTLLVEGPSDLLYLKWMSQMVEERGGQGLDPRWTITPCGGIDKIGSFLALFAGNDLNVAVLTDFGQGDKSKVRALRESELLKSGHVLSADMYVDQTTADIEDVLGRDLYLDLINRCYGLTGEDQLPREGDPDEQVLKDVAAAFKLMPPEVPEFDHFRPASFLVEHGAAMAAELPGLDEALARFEAVFADLNSCLPST